MRNTSYRHIQKRFLSTISARYFKLKKFRSKISYRKFRSYRVNRIDFFLFWKFRILFKLKKSWRLQFKFDILSYTFYYTYVVVSLIINHNVIINIIYNNNLNDHIYLHPYIHYILFFLSLYILFFFFFFSPYINFRICGDSRRKVSFLISLIKKIVKSKI